MGRRLTEKEKEEKLIKKVVKRIIGLESVYPKRIIERACFRYKDANLRKRNALKEKQVLERQLAETKRLLGEE